MSSTAIVETLSRRKEVLLERRRLLRVRLDKYDKNIQALERTIQCFLAPEEEPENDLWDIFDDEHQDYIKGSQE